MVQLELVPGRKGPNDVLVKVYSYGEILSFSEWLFIGKNYMDGERSYYPISEGNRGPCMLLEALIELSHGADFNRVLKRFDLDQKRSLNIIDKRKSPTVEPRPIEKRI